MLLPVSELVHAFPMSHCYGRLDDPEERQEYTFIATNTYDKTVPHTIRDFSRGLDAFLHHKQSDPGWLDKNIERVLHSRAGCYPR